MSNVPPYQPMQPMQPANPNDQRATYVLIAGILSLVCCGLAGIYALIVGNTLKKEYGGTIPSPGNIGYILGIIGLVLTVLGTIFYVLVFIVFATTGTTTYGY
jgi:hypothetical protein